MRTRTTRSVAILATSVILFGVVGLAPAASATDAFLDDGTGITCSLTGFVTFDPPLTQGAIGTSMIKFHDRLHNCSGAVTQFGVTITGGSQTISGSEVITSNCVNLAGPGTASIPAWVMKTRYYPRAGSLVPNSYTTWAAGAAHVTVSDPLVLTYTEATKVTGSFSAGTGPSPSLTEVIDQTTSTLITECQSVGGIKKLTFMGVNGASSVTLG